MWLHQEGKIVQEGWIHCSE